MTRCALSRDSTGSWQRSRLGLAFYLVWSLIFQGLCPRTDVQAMDLVQHHSSYLELMRQTFLVMPWAGIAVQRIAVHYKQSCFDICRLRCHVWPGILEVEL